MEFKFIKWQKISDRTSDYNLCKKDKSIFSPKSLWFATEKIHGANFSIYFINSNIKYAKRNGFLEEEEWFYNYQIIKPKLEKNIKLLSQKLDNKNIIVYGELFGGYYPKEPEIFDIKERINEMNICIVPFEQRAIQEGIYYSPNIEYIIYDIAIINLKGEVEFLSYELIIKLVNQTELLVAKPLVIGTFDKVSNYDINFNSTIPEILGLRSFLPKKNLAEGIVIRPLNNYILTNSTQSEYTTRCLIKIKNKKFLEISENFDLEQASKSNQYILSKLITQNRFNSVISKIGKLTETNYEYVLEEFIQDVLIDLYKLYPNIYIEDIDSANKFIKDYSKNIFKQNLKNNNK